MPSGPDQLRRAPCTAIRPDSQHALPSFPSVPPRVASAWARPLLLALVLTAAGCGLAYWLIGAPPLLGAEDAAIGFRYARNLAEGYGVVFNPGGEHVEGVTSLSWLFLSAAVYAVMGEAGLEGALLLISLALTIGTLTVVFRLVEGTAASAEARAGAGTHTATAMLSVAAAWLLAQAGFYFWSGLSIMDVAPWAAGLSLLVFAIDRRLGARTPATPGSRIPAPATTEVEASRASRAALGVLVVALVLTRPEAMLVVPGALLVAAFAYGRSRRLRTLAIDLGATTAASVGLLTAWRLAYFGHPLPNTYYVKVAPDVLWRMTRGVVYIGEYVSAHPVAWMGGLAVLGSVVTRAISVVSAATSAGQQRSSGLAEARRFAGQDTAVFLAGFIVLGFFSVVYGGGDHYQGHRFLQSYLPLVAVPLAAGTGALSSWWARRAYPAPALVGVVLAGSLLLAQPTEWRTYQAHGLRRQAIDVGLQGRFVGQTLDLAFEGGPRPELGLWMVGGASYAYHGPVKDLLGLNWIAMGMSPGDRKGPRDHAAFNADVFWSAPPEVMIPEPEVVLGPLRCVRTVMGGAFGGLLTTERFRDAFEPVRIQRGAGEAIIAYARSDWLRSAPSVVEPLGWSHCDIDR